MDAIVVSVNATAFAVISAAIALVVILPIFRDGVVIKLGLIFMSIGFGIAAGALADGAACVDMRTLGGAMLLVHVGLPIVAAGWWLRSRRARAPLRRSTDWMALEQLERRSPR